MILSLSDRVVEERVKQNIVQICKFSYQKVWNFSLCCVTCEGVHSKHPLH